MFEILKKQVTYEPSQKEALPGQVANNAGGYSFAVKDFEQFRRFLILGTAGGTYYVTQKDLTKQNLTVLDRCLAADGPRFVQMITDVSFSGAAAKNDPAIYALAMAVSKGDKITKELAYGAVPVVCRTFTHLSHFITYVHKGKLRGWGRAFKRAVANWYNQKNVEYLAMQVVKYGSRDGISQKDVYRLSHPASFLKGDITDERRALYDYIAKDKLPEGSFRPEGLGMIVAAEQLKSETDQSTILSLIDKFHLPLEAVPTDKRSKEVYTQIVTNKPGITFLIRNLATLTRLGVLNDVKVRKAVIDRLTDREVLKNGRVHPLSIYLALTTYKSGKSVKGSSTWTPIVQIIDALDDAFRASFQFVEKTDKTVLYAIDTSGSMRVFLHEYNCWLFEVAGVMAMAAAASTPNFYSMSFNTSAAMLDISPKQRIDDIVKTLEKYGGGTDTSLPFTFAGTQGLDIDTFVVFTDSETWAGRYHAEPSFDKYKKARNKPNARAINVAMIATNLSTFNTDRDDIAEIAGFSAEIPQIVSTFSEGVL